MASMSESIASWAASISASTTTPMMSTDPPPNQRNLPEPAAAFDPQMIAEFERYLATDPAHLALTGNKRAKLRMILDDDFEVPRKTVFGEDRPQREYKCEVTERWRARSKFFLNDKLRIMRKAENKLEVREVACVSDAHRYIIDKHLELSHAGHKRTFAAVQQVVWGIRRDDIVWLVSKCQICKHQRRSNEKKANPLALTCCSSCAAACAAGHHADIT